MDKPTILIGEDHAHLTLERESVESDNGGPIASRTKLGWMVHGRLNDLKD